jgi:two-component system, sensor histidine kinase PdtaS
MRTTAVREDQHALAALREIARALSSAWDLDTTLALIARKTTEVMGVDSCTIYLLDPDDETLRLRATTGLARRALGRATLKVGEGMTGYAVERNQPVHAADAQHDPHFKWLDEAEERAFQSLLAVPLVVNARPIGALNVQMRAAHEYTAEEAEILSLIGDLAAGALVKAQLYDRQTSQIEELRTLAQVSEALTSPQYLDDILDIVTSMAAQTMNAAVCSLFLLDESNGRLELRSATRKTSPYRHREPLLVGEGAVGQVVQSGQPVYIADVRTDPRYKNRELARSEGLVSLLAVPLMVRERVIGVLNCYTAVPRHFSEEQRAMFSTLAGQTALAIENTRLVTNAAVIREMHHRIKNNLQTVAMLMQLQLGEAAQLDARQVLETSMHRVRSIAAVHEVLSEQGFRLVDVKDVLQRITRMTVESMTAPNKLLAITIEGEALLLPARAATALALVVNELVQNALDHAFPDQKEGRPEGHIHISLGRSPEEIVIVVRDNGIGLPDELIQGVGLEIVETLVRDDLQGRLKFTRLPTGAEVSLRIPRAVERAMDNG